MNRADKRRQRKIAAKAAKSARKITPASPDRGDESQTLQQVLQHARQCHNKGDLVQAEALYRKILQTDPNHPDALHLLGVVAHQSGKFDLAIDLISRALVITPTFAEAHCSLANALRALGKLDQAAASYQKATQIKPDYFEALNNLGITLKALDKLDDAVDCYQKAIAAKPDFSAAHFNLGNILKDQGKLDKAAECFRASLVIEPHADTHFNLANVLKDLWLLDEAATHYRQAIALNPDYVEAYSNLGNTLKDLRKPDEALASYQKALAINPDFPDAHSNMGRVLHDLGKLDLAVDSYRKALAINPDFADAHSNMANAFKDLGLLDEAVDSYRKSLSIRPGFIDTHSNLLLAEQYRPQNDSRSLYHLHLQWDERHGQRYRKAWPEHKNNPEPDRPLRIGFVSPDLGRHPVGYFLVGLLENLAKNEIETFCYSDRVADDLTDRIRAATDIWHDVRGILDETLFKMILHDEIDILVDLTGHSANNRLLIFARKPAPLQVAWAGYIGTTGLAAIDYLLTDIYSTPEDEEEFYSEKIIRMPDGWLCYDPPSYAPAVGPTPLKHNKFITFASFSNMAKINMDVVALWSEILHSVPESRLLIKYKMIDSMACTERLLALFQAHRIDPARLLLEGHAPHEKLLARYNDVDIALDPFPYSGGLTTYEALWMGVPVITVPGQTFASRHAQSHLSTIGVLELIAHDGDDYLKLAVELAGDIDRLVAYRETLRQKMTASPTCDTKKFADGFTNVMRGIWRDWCLSNDN